MISAEVICDSVSPQGQRLTTFELRYPKFIHGEFMTHRVFSRNASSSRAIPTEKLLAEVRSDDLRAGPVFWGKNQKGMQAAEELVGDELDLVQTLWRSAAMDAARNAEKMLDAGAHKQIVNRVLEPYSHINVVCSATEYMNFFGLRLDKAAQPEARALAEAMWHAYLDSAPTPLKPGEWHLPYANDKETWASIGEHARAIGPAITESVLMNTLIAVSVARCARVSYKSYETGKTSTVKEDLALYERLLGAQPLHASPAEHQATPDEVVWKNDPAPLRSRSEYWATPNEHGNFVGWRQYRKMLPGEACAPLPAGYHLSN